MAVRLGWTDRHALSRNAVHFFGLNKLIYANYQPLFLETFCK